jgi:hypothetical protein
MDSTNFEPAKQPASAFRILRPHGFRRSSAFGQGALQRDHTPGVIAKVAIAARVQPLWRCDLAPQSDRSFTAHPRIVQDFDLTARKHEVDATFVKKQTGKLLMHLQNSLADLFPVFCIELQTSVRCHPAKVRAWARAALRRSSARVGSSIARDRTIPPTQRETKARAR